MEAEALWTFLPIGYLLTVAVETTVLWVGLSPRYSAVNKLFYGIWLTACTYPIVVLVLPLAMYTRPHWQYLAVAEAFAPVAECSLFWLAERRSGKRDAEYDPALTRRIAPRDFVAIVVANLASFAVGEVWIRWRF